MSIFPGQKANSFGQLVPPGCSIPQGTHIRFLDKDADTVDSVISAGNSGVTLALRGARGWDQVSLIKVDRVGTGREWVRPDHSSRQAA